MSTALSYETIDPPGSANNAGHPITHSSGPMVVQAPYFPTYRIIGHAIRALDGEPVSRIREMMNAIYEQRGTPQTPVDWSSPDIWIDARLSGELQTLAHKVWESSLKALNPRHLRGSYLFINRLKLLDQVAGTYRIGERGRLFLAGNEALIRELDAGEGIPKLLSLVAEHSPCRRADLLPAWSEYLRVVSVFKTPVTFIDSLRRRLVNATDRGLISHKGNTYTITEAGLAWLKRFASDASLDSAPADSHSAGIGPELTSGDQADEVIEWSQDIEESDRESTEIAPMTALFSTQTFLLGQLVPMIHHGTLGLPELQRPFVWSKTKVRDLFDSLYRGYPIGYFLFWKNA
jgi:hypothetical protein